MPIRKKLGEILIDQKALTPEHLAKALEMQKAAPMPIGTLLVKRGFCRKGDVLKGLSAQSGLDGIDLETVVMPHNIAAYVDSKFCEANRCLLIEIDESTRPRKTITFAVTTPLNPVVTEDLARKKSVAVRQKIALQAQIDEQIKKAFYAQDFGYDLSFHENSGGFRRVKPDEPAPRKAPPPDPREVSHPFDEEMSAPSRPRLANTDKEVDAIREQLNTLQLHLNAVIRILARKGSITREEFAAELAKMGR